jgi:LacI family transcriptional regulator
MQSIAQSVAGRERLVGLAEVARRAGVSASTASRALNRPEMVSDAVVARVRRVADELGYAPNPFARSLRLQDSRTLGLIVPDNTNPFFAESAKCLEAACFAAGYTLILCNTDRSLEKEAAQARVLYDKRVDGVLMFNTSDRSAATIEWLLERSLPVVLLERRSPGPPVDCVISDNAAGVRAALEHLVGLGHRRIACLLGEPHVSHYAERRAAYDAAVPSLGLIAGPEYVRDGLVSYADGQWAAAALLRLDEPPTALFCANDTLAIGAIRGAELAGRRVPEDLALVGYGDTTIASYTRPSLTSVRQDRAEVGERAVRQVLARIAQRSKGARARPRVQIVPTQLVVRESSQSAAAGPAYAMTRESAV